jgi:predicted nuclease with TOPRIM domain
MVARTLLLTVGLGVSQLLSGCSSSCESVQNEIEKIGQEISKNPESAMQREKELTELRDKLREMGCL